MERRLGRGLGSLLGQSAEPGSPTPDAEGPSSSAADAAAAGPAAAPSDRVTPTARQHVEAAAQFVAVGAIHRNPDQPRKTFDSAALEELRQSVERHGILQPICVRRDGEGFEIISGERRWRAARMAGLKVIPATVKDDIDDAVSLELAIVENVQREDLDALEKAKGYQALMDRFGLTQEAVAERVGLKRSSVTNHLRLLDLPADAQEALGAGLISMGHARALLGLKDEREILGALGQVVRKELSVRETEQLARQPEGSPARESEPTKEIQPAAPWVNELEDRIRQKLGVKVQLRNGKRYKGAITLEYANREELERLVEQIAPKETI